MYQILLLGFLGFPGQSGVRYFAPPRHNFVLRRPPYHGGWSGSIFDAYSTTPIPFLLYTTVVPSTTTVENLEESYHLKSFSWALSLLNSERNSLEFSANGKNVTLELSKSDIPPKDAADSDCAQSAGAPSEAGVCVYLTRCAAARDISLDEYRTTYCVVENKYAGVCCPKNKVDVTTTP